MPRTESLNILGNTISVDYQDERKFAEAAANLARTAEQVVALTHRQQYHDDPAAGWEHFRDGQTGGEFNEARHWGLDEWTSRSAQGAYYHWAVGNAMLLDVDDVNTGIQKIDRSTVPELQLLAVTADSFQTTIDNANAHLNPLGLSPGAIAFDISPAELRAGNSHYEQVYGRALAAVLNAKGSFDQAARMTRLLRNQENQIDEFNTSIEDEERGFNYQLIDLYGSPYPGDVGPGKTYAQGYGGPDLNNWFVVDRPSGLVNTTEAVTIEARVPIGIREFEGFDITKINESSTTEETETRSFDIQPNQFVIFADQWKPGTDIGKRSVTGRLQQALVDAQLVHMAVLEAGERLKDDYTKFDRRAKLMSETIAYHKALKDSREASNDRRDEFTLLELEYRVISAGFKALKDKLSKTSISLTEGLPKVLGFSNDPTAPLRGTIRTSGGIAGGIAQASALVYGKAADLWRALKEREARDLTLRLEELGFSFEEKQLAFEFEIQFQKVVDRYFEIAQLALQLQRASEEVRTVMALGDRMQLEREIFRKRAATVVQGFRTNDLTFRTFRNEALEQYRTLFDLASRYAYLAANSYDYETGLLGTPEGQAVISRIVASRALGDLTDGQPQATVSTLGDAGLAGTMAQLQADWSVAEGRLGINNPDQNGTLFSLRQELFRILDDPEMTDDDQAWQQMLEQHMVSDLMSDPDVATHCRNLRKPDGSAVAGIVIPFSSTIEHGKNFFGLPLAGADHAFSPSNFATKIYSVGVVLEGYVGMDPYAEFIPGAGEPDSNDPNVLSATPYLYLIPVGVDKMLAPPLGDTGEERFWMVQDQALPLPYNLGANAFSTTQFFDANGTLTEQPWILRKHQAFRPVDDPVFFYSGLRDEFDSARLIGRSVWNTGWKIVIPAYALLNDEQEGLDRFAATVDDIKLFLRTYSHSGN